jgi:hypothetical protein
MSAFESAWVHWTVAGIGCLILMIQIVRWQSGHGHSALDETSAANAWVGQAVAGVILFLLSWCLISAMNACGRVDPVLTRWVPLPHFVSWLPHSFDGNATWKTFFLRVGVGGVFLGNAKLVFRILASGMGIQTRETQVFPAKAAAFQNRAALPARVDLGIDHQWCIVGIGCLVATRDGFTLVAGDIQRSA